MDIDKLLEKLYTDDMLTEDLFNFDSTFNMLINCTMIDGKKLINNCEFLNDMVKDYNEILNKQFNKFKKIIKLGVLNERELYTREFKVNEKGDFFVLIWSIEKLKQYIYKSKLEAHKINIKDFIGAIDKSGLTDVGLTKSNENKDPIIIVNMPVIQPNHIVIDGNHRLINLNAKGINNIDAYIIKPKYIKNGLFNEFFAILFYIHNNISVIINYLMGQATKKELREYLYPIINKNY